SQKLFIPGLRVPEPRGAPPEKLATFLVEEFFRARVAECRVELLHHPGVDDRPRSESEFSSPGAPPTPRRLAVLGNSGEVVVLRFRRAAGEVSGVIAGHQAQHGGD